MSSLENIPNDSKSTKSNDSNKLNPREYIKRILKYVIEGLAVAIASRYIPKNRMELKEIVMIGCTSACVFALLDIYAPSISLAARHGAGFVIGNKLLQ